MKWRWINIVLGIWLMASPAIMQYGGQLENNNRFIGPLVVSFATIALWQVTRGVRWMNLLFGLWLLPAAYVFPTEGSSAPQWMTAVVGMIMAAAAIPRGKVDTPFGGGWGTVFCPCNYYAVEPFPGATPPDQPTVERHHEPKP